MVYEYQANGNNGLFTRNVHTNINCYGRMHAAFQWSHRQVTEYDRLALLNDAFYQDKIFSVPVNVVTYVSRAYDNLRKQFTGPRFMPFSNHRAGDARSRTLINGEYVIAVVRPNGQVLLDADQILGDGGYNVLSNGRQETDGLLLAGANSDATTYDV